MAQLTVTAVCEMDLVDDAIRALSYAMGALSCRHGDAYRDYERRLERMLDSPLGEMTFCELEPMRMIAIPPSEWRAMVDEGVRMGVI